MAWEADVKIAGPVGAMGQRVLQPIVNQQVGQVLAALEERIEAASGAGGAEQGIHPASPEAYGAEPEARLTPRPTSPSLLCALYRGLAVL